MESIGNAIFQLGNENSCTYCSRYSDAINGLECGQAGSLLLLLRYSPPPQPPGCSDNDTQGCKAIITGYTRDFIIRTTQ